MANVPVQCKGKCRVTGVRPCLQEHRLWAALAPSRSSGSLWYCWDSPWAEAADHIPSHCLSLLHAVTQPPTYVSRPHLSPKLQIRVSNWAPTSLPPGDPGTLKPSRVPARVGIFPHPYFLLGFSRLSVWSGPRLQTSASSTSLTHRVLLFLPTTTTGVQGLCPPLSPGLSPTLG